MGGNDILRFLGRISGPNKHRVSLTTTPMVNGLELTELNMGGLIDFPMLPERISHTGDFMIAKVKPDGHFSTKFNYQFKFELSEPHPHLTIDGFSMLSAMVQISEDIIAALKDQATSKLTT